MVFINSFRTSYGWKFLKYHLYSPIIYSSTTISQLINLFRRVLPISRKIIASILHDHFEWMYRKSMKLRPVNERQRQIEDLDATIRHLHFFFIFQGTHLYSWRYLIVAPNDRDFFLHETIIWILILTENLRCLVVAYKSSIFWEKNNTIILTSFSRSFDKILDSCSINIVVVILKGTHQIQENIQSGWNFFRNSQVQEPSKSGILLFR